MRLTLATKRQIIKKQQAAYRRSSRKTKTRILNALEVSTGLSRDHLARILREGYKDGSRLAKETRGRKAKYGMEHKKLLAFLWELLYCLKASLEDVMKHMTEDLLKSFPETVIKEVLEMSHGTMDRLLRSNRQAMKPFGLSTTKPGSMLKDQIPIRRGTDWEDAKPGFVEIDLVAHCGDTNRGEFLLTLDCTDIASGWTECRAVINKARTHTLTAMKTIQKQLPFTLLGIDSDNGSEFINHHFFQYCQDQDLVFTRSRPNHSNDACYVEQKNWSVVRRFIGYGRFCGHKTLELFNDFYQKLSDLNNFLPSQKLIQRKRVGDKVKKQHDKALTPYRRLLLNPQIKKEDKETLQNRFKALNLITLRKEMDRLLEEIRACSLGYTRTID